MRSLVLRLLTGGWVFTMSVLGISPTSLAEPLEGMLEPFEVVELSSQMAGILDEVTVERGDFVKAGQIVARLTSGVEKASVDLARARVEFGERKVLRNEELFKKELISIHEKDEMETDVQLSRLQLREAEERLNLRIVRSPISGVVVERSHAPGEFVGEEDSILTIACINPLNVEVIAPIEYLGTIQKGSVAKVRPESPITRVYKARVVIVDPIVDAASGTFGIRLELSNPSFALPAGLKCNVFFPESE